MTLLRIVAAVGLSLGLSVAPALAQPGSAFGLQFHFQDPSFETRGPSLALCKTDRQIREAIASRGYANIALNVPNERRVQVRASLNGRTYLLDYDFCNDTIVDRDVLR